MSQPRPEAPPPGINPAEFAHIAATEQSFWWFRGMDRMLWRFLAENEPQFRRLPVCEVGCGTGWVSGQFRERYPDTPLLSIDLEAEGLRYARARGLDRLTQADIRALPLASGAFGLLMALDVIAHLEPGQERDAFREFSRVLAPGGILLLRASAFSWLRSRHSAFVCERQRYTLGQLRQLLEANGLELLRSTYANTFLLPIAFLKFRLWEPLTQAKPASGLQAVHPLLNTVLEQFLRAEAAWLRRGGSFPLGQSLWLVARKREHVP